MDTNFKDYLALLNKLSQTLDQLSDSANGKTAAVRGDDLQKLDEYIKKEQALSLSLRSMDRKREKLLADLGLSNVPLSALAGKYPEELKAEAMQTVEALTSSFQIYQSAAEAARTTLEINLHQIEKVLYGEQNPAPSNPEPPAPMRADIRA